LYYLISISAFVKKIQLINTKYYRDIISIYQEEDCIMQKKIRILIKGMQDKDTETAIYRKYGINDSLTKMEQGFS